MSPAPSGKKSVLVLAAHGDDMEFTAGGTIAKFTDRGHKVALIVHRPRPRAPGGGRSARNRVTSTGRSLGSHDRSPRFLVRGGVSHGPALAGHAPQLLAPLPGGIRPIQPDGRAHVAQAEDQPTRKTKPICTAACDVLRRRPDTTRALLGGVRVSGVVSTAHALRSLPGRDADSFGRTRNLFAPGSSAPTPHDTARSCSGCRHSDPLNRDSL